nr:two-component response regulator ORR33-like isoform X3 [Setaria viridis]
MEDDMAAMFPNGIRTLILDDDTKFLKSATMLLSLLNFDVASPLFLTPKSLTSGDLKGFDVILVHAAKAAACSFDFHAIMEADLLISISSTDNEATGEEAD